MFIKTIQRYIKKISFPTLGLSAPHPRWGKQLKTNYLFFEKILNRRYSHMVKNSGGTREGLFLQPSWRAMNVGIFMCIFTNIFYSYVRSTHLFNFSSKLFIDIVISSLNCPACCIFLLTIDLIICSISMWKASHSFYGVWCSTAWLNYDLGPAPFWWTFIHIFCGLKTICNK